MSEESSNNSNTSGQVQPSIPRPNLPPIPRPENPFEDNNA